MKALDLIKKFEGLSLKPYLDVVGIPTIGYGSTYYLDGTKVSMNDKPITQELADKLLENVVNKFKADLMPLIKVTLNDNQMSSLLSFAYNLGVGALKKSTLLKRINEGNFEAAAEEFLKWSKAGGKQVPGLLRSRQEERALFISR